MELLQQSMIVLEFYLLYRVFAIETLVVQGIHFKTRYNFFLGITTFSRLPSSSVSQIRLFFNRTKGRGTAGRILQEILNQVK